MMGWIVAYVVQQLEQRVHADLNYEDITLAELCFEMLCAAETLQLTVDHDCQPRTQCFALLHAARATT